MILQKNEIQDIINKKSNSKNDLYISEEECLNLKLNDGDKFRTKLVFNYLNQSN